MTMPTPVPLGLSPSFGFGDRLGLATPGHVAAMKRAGQGIAPIFAQQSIREMTRTNRTPEQVMADALRAAQEAGWTGPQGADADHLKTEQDIERTAAAGFCFFTIDPSGEVDAHADDYSPSQLAEKFKAVAAEVNWIDTYRGRQIRLPTGTSIDLNEAAVLKAAVKYGRAINMTQRLAQHIDATMKKLGKPYEIELSVDETPQPTTLAEHWIIADQCRLRGIKLISLAPRYVGEFEKGVDYKGDLAAFERSLADHAAIAHQLGPYKLSLHSGSDKLTIYPSFARLTRGRFHVKTAGTSYLEALRVVLRHDEALFRRIVDFSRSRYETDRATYHVSATLDKVPPPSDIKDATRLEQIYLQRWCDVRGSGGFTEPGRQILHTTFGSVLTDPTLKPQVMQILREHRATYDSILAEHFAKHLSALRAGM
ncbi:tagaturonate epimerase family protein [Fontivita pretiosa]|uniref:tagaturonate epimerase family protein n=1 Tax=Fontivita pretiosa TaxID=2989684 RepID=UPI003D16CA9D